MSSVRVDIYEIIAQEADEPNAVIDFLQPELLTGQDGGDLDLLAVDAEPSAMGDDGVVVVEGATNRRRSSMTEVSLHGINTSQS
jgi:hypothetical protein